jgi:hypothetical protein
MVRLIVTALVFIPMVAGIGLASAQQPTTTAGCAEMVSRIEKDVSTRYDPAAAEAKVKLPDIAKMCQGANKAEAEKAARDLALKLGMKM